MSKRLTTKEFIEKAQKIHGNKYDYSKVNYINENTKVIIICPEHGEFEQTPHCHLSNKECPRCGRLKANKSEGDNGKIFIEKAQKIHGNKYDYSLVDYKRSKDRVIIKCLIHSNFKQTPAGHLSGRGCPKCKNILLSQYGMQTQEEWIEKAKKVHGNKYDYSLVNYIDCKTKIKIVCPKHGQFKQNPTNHLTGQGCPHCSESKSERIIRVFLINHNINFIPQKRFKDCKDKQQLPFDFYLPDYNLCIEYQGYQHYMSIKKWGGKKILKIVQYHDQIKKEYCKNNGINFFEIKYTEDTLKKLEEALSEFVV
jgi:hypothetical protein